MAVGLPFRSVATPTYPHCKYRYYFYFSFNMYLINCYKYRTITVTIVQNIFKYFHFLSFLGQQIVSWSY